VREMEDRANEEARRQAMGDNHQPATPHNAVLPTYDSPTSYEAGHGWSIEVVRPLDPCQHRRRPLPRVARSPITTRQWRRRV